MPLPVEAVPMPAPAPMQPLSGTNSQALALALQAALQRPQPSYAGPPGGLDMPQLQGAGPAQNAPMPWKQQWQDYLVQQAAYRQQLAQQLHGLGPYSNALTLPQVGAAVNARRNEVMQYLMGAGGPRSYLEPQG